MLLLRQMQITITGNDVGVLVFGALELKKEPQSHLKLIINNGKETTERAYWDSALKHLVGQTRFGRIGILYDQHNKEAKNWAEGLQAQDLNYKPANPRSEKILQISLFPLTMLKNMACEGQADSVEFRRWGRRMLREAKNAHCDTLFFPEAIFGESRTKSILQHLAGKSTKVYSVADFYQPQSTKNPQRVIEIIHEQDEVWMNQRAETLLKTKLKK